VKAGTVIGARARRHRGVEARAFLDRVGGSVPPGLEVHLVPDKLRTPKARLTHAWPVERPRSHLHSTPTVASCVAQPGRVPVRAAEPPPPPP
jgi:hypothetical protein